MVRLSGKVGTETIRLQNRACSGVKSTVMANDLPIGVRVMAPVGDVLHRGVVAEPPADHPQDGGTVCVKFTPPVKTAEPFESVDYITCPADRVTAEWF
jgi:hypothetical protein